jgi:dihydrofolate synthase/folylpolyglutamate synthase
LFSLSKTGIKLGLENTRKLLKHFGDPHLQRRTIHIAGTNGKGSTAVFIESILRSAGYRTGLYTSPHLNCFEERIQVNRLPIPPEDLIRLSNRVRQVVEKYEIPVTFFEFGTVLAFLYFNESDTDWNIIEVGLGGRLDATNLTQAEISIITSISLDHTEYLGQDLKGIAKEKALIIKGYGTVFAHIHDEEVQEVVETVAREQSARLFWLGKDFKVRQTDMRAGQQKFDYIADDFQLDQLETSLIGQHQAENAALAIAACCHLAAKNGKIDAKHIRQGVKNAHWPGRLEIIAKDPRVVLDCAHNPAGVNNLTKTLRQVFAGRKVILVLGVMRDKPLEEMMKSFSQLAETIILVKPRQERSEDPYHLQKKYLHEHNKVEVIEAIPRALESAIARATSEDIICVTGSIFTVAEARKWMFDDSIPDNSSSFLGS